MNEQMPLAKIGKETVRAIDENIQLNAQWFDGIWISISERVTFVGSSVCWFFFFVRLHRMTRKIGWIGCLIAKISWKVCYCEEKNIAVCGLISCIIHRWVSMSQTAVDLIMAIKHCWNQYPLSVEQGIFESFERNLIKQTRFASRRICCCCPKEFNQKFRLTRLISRLNWNIFLNCP